jgi:hypothetical protein
MSSDFLDLINNSKSISIKEKPTPFIVSLEPNVIPNGQLIFVDSSSKETVFISFQDAKKIIEDYLYEKELRNKNSTLQDAYDQYKVLLRLI